MPRRVDKRGTVNKAINGSLRIVLIGWWVLYALQKVSSAYEPHFWITSIVLFLLVIAKVCTFIDFLINEDD